MRYTATAIFHKQCNLGEGPLWDERSSSLYALDCMGKTLYQMRSNGDLLNEWRLPHTPASFVLNEAGEILMAYRRGLAIVSPSASISEHAIACSVDFEREIFNDGKCDPSGRFWVGTMDRWVGVPGRESTTSVGAIYCMGSDLAVKRVAAGVSLSNGFAWSPDGKYMYHCDTRAQKITRWEYGAANGVISSPSIFVDFSERHGRPDGCTIDSEGGVWVAEIGASKIVRFNESGVETDEVVVPTTRPTSAIFGGPDFRTLYVTSMRNGLTPEQLEAEPLAGSIFAVSLPIPGMKEPRFRG